MIKIKFNLIVLILIISHINCTKKEHNLNGSFDVISWVQENKGIRQCNPFSIATTNFNGKISNIRFKAKDGTTLLKDTILNEHNISFLVHEKKVDGEQLTICTFKNKNNFFEITFKSINDSLIYWKTAKYISNYESIYQKSSFPIKESRFSNITEVLTSPLFLPFINSLKDYGIGGGGYEISYDSCNVIIKEFRFFHGSSTKTYMLENPPIINSMGTCVYLDKNLYPIH